MYEEKAEVVRKRMNIVHCISTKNEDILFFVAVKSSMLHIYI